MTSTESLRKVRGTLRVSVSRIITLLTELLQNPDAEARRVMKHVKFLKSKEAELRQLDRKILDVIEDEALDKELEDSAEYHEVLYAIADGQYFLSEREQSVLLRDTCYPPFAYARRDSGNYNRAGLCKIADDCDSISEGMQRDMTSFEGSDSNHKSGLSASPQRDEKENNIESAVMTCRNMEPPREEVFFGSDQATMMCVEGPPEQTLHAVNWTREEQPLENGGSIPKRDKEPKEDQVIAILESTGGSRENVCSGGPSTHVVVA